MDYFNGRREYFTLNCSLEEGKYELEEIKASAESQGGASMKKMKEMIETKDEKGKEVTLIGRGFWNERNNVQYESFTLANRSLVNEIDRLFFDNHDKEWMSPIRDSLVKAKSFIVNREHTEANMEEGLKQLEQIW